MIKEITKESELIINGDTMLVFYADWCGPCKAYAPTYERFSRNYSDVTIYRVNVDKSPELAAKYNVRSIPATVFFTNGRERSEIGMFSYKKIQSIFNKE